MYIFAFHKKINSLHFSSHLKYYNFDHSYVSLFAQSQNTLMCIAAQSLCASQLKAYVHSGSKAMCIAAQRLCALRLKALVHTRSKPMCISVHSNGLKNEKEENRLRAV